MEAICPIQPAVLDRKTSERVHLLFSYRAQALGHQYLNDRLIPALSAKGRGPDLPTSVERSPVTVPALFELQAWLGHRRSDGRDAPAHRPRSPKHNPMTCNA
jgi:hypothetical protein